MQILDQREHVRSFLKLAAKAEDAGEPLKSLSQEGAQEEMLALQVFGMIKVSEVADDISVTVAGRTFAGMLVGDIPEFGPGKIAEMRGSITETELAARYLEGKVGGVEKAMREGQFDKDTLAWLGRVLTNTADEFRQQLHIPALMIEGKVKVYNEDNETGIRHAANLALFFSDVGERNVRAGWWSNIETGEPKKRNLGELLILFVTEIVEAYDAWLEGAPDDKLPEHPGFGVEMADLGIRWADLCGAALRGDIAGPNGDPNANPGERMFQEIRAIARWETPSRTLSRWISSFVWASSKGEPDASTWPAMDEMRSLVCFSAMVRLLLISLQGLTSSCRLRQAALQSCDRGGGH